MINVTKFWKSYYSPNIRQADYQLRGAEPRLKLK